MKGMIEIKSFQIVASEIEKEKEYKAYFQEVIEFYSLNK